MGKLSSDVYMVAGGVTKFAKAHPDRTFQVMVKQAFDGAVKDVPEFAKYRDVINEVQKGSGVAIHTGGEKEITVKKIHESIDYIESHAQDTPYFMALAEGKLIGSMCTGCGYRYASPHAYCNNCGSRTDWFDLPEDGKIHCHSVRSTGEGNS